VWVSSPSSAWLGCGYTLNIFSSKVVPECRRGPGCSYFCPSYVCCRTGGLKSWPTAMCQWRVCQLSSSWCGGDVASDSTEVMALVFLPRGPRQVS
jgi:hypothetical protein